MKIDRRIADYCKEANDLMSSDLLFNNKKEYCRRKRNLIAKKRRISNYKKNMF